MLQKSCTAIELGKGPKNKIMKNQQNIAQYYKNRKKNSSNSKKKYMFPINW